ncbi:hypothetical protein AUO94_08130 [Planococcus kocurii]|uniref:Uncharacterized protein n=1 Tax=Planococcus kocurii TaxID=1374 RepID=A0ABN4JZ28_9BACL|nr:hypothetical protein [Planococcus kocurii]ALS78630.1 hypothetical protein AUO94_08130 [Planococcus kocurii]
MAQALDYASWVKDLSYKEIESIVLNYLDKSLADAFAERVLTSLPEELNKEHSIVIMASELDASSERIVLVGDGEHRSWEDCRKYGFMSAG